VLALQVRDLQPSRGLVLARAATVGCHDGIVVSGAVGSSVVGIADLPRDGGGGEAYSLARQHDLVVGGVLYVFRPRDDLSSRAAGPQGLHRDVLEGFPHYGGHHLAQVGVGDVVIATDEVLEAALADGGGGGVGVGHTLQAISTFAVFEGVALKVTLLALEFGAHVAAATLRVLVHPRQTRGPL